MKIIRFMGVSLSGGKNTKTCVTVIDYYPDYQKIFLKEIYDKVSAVDDTSHDKELLKILNQKNDTKYVAFDAPLTLPYCLLHSCKGIESCKAPTTKWHWQHYKKIKKNKKNLRLFTPYTERCVEKYINYELEEFFEMPEALGANKAPLTVRAIYLKNKVNKKLIEVFPKLSVYRMGQRFHLPKNDLRNYKHSVFGLDCRNLFLSALIEKEFLFIYQQDLSKLIDNPNAFESMICALTAYLKYINQTEEPPKGFPDQEGWVEFPKIDFHL